ncbi:MAG: hypothetical protein ABIP51_01175, partial [Bacteroidia bacterium]
NRGMDDKSGSEFLEKIKYYHPIIPVIILSEHSIAKNSFDVLNYNICGYMLKDNNDLEKIKYFLDSLSSKKKEIEKIDCI